MILVECLKQTCSSFLKRITSPQKLSDWMTANIEYGWLDKHLRKHHDFDNWFDEVLIVLPDKTYRYKIGTCYEQVLFQYAVMTNCFPTYSLKMIHIHQHFKATHAIFCYKVDNFWFYFEQSDYQNRGIYKSKTLQKILTFVKRNMIARHGQSSFTITEMPPEKFTRDMSAKEFFTIVNLDYTKL